jgi:tetratricopeptide (TPR) repeat protein
MQEARVFLARSLLAQNKLDEAEKLFRGVLDDPLPTTLSMAWANIGLGQLASRKGQAAEAAKRFNDAARAEADYGTAVIARAERIKAEATPAIDESARAFISQLDAAIVSGKKADLESRIVSGELVRFVGGIVGTQPEAWQTRVLRTEQFDANTLVADVAIQAKELGKDQAGPAVLVLSKAGGAWKLAAIELFEVR